MSKSTLAETTFFSDIGWARMEPLRFLINVDNDSGARDLFKVERTGDAAIDVWIGEDGTLSFEGATDDTNELTITVEDPDADRFVVIPNEGLSTNPATLHTQQMGTSTLTDATATDLLSFPLANGVFVAGTVVTVTTCINAANTVVRHDTADWICLNAADTESCSFGSNLGAALEHNDGAGNFTGTYTLAVSTAGTNEVRFTLDADCSLGTITTLETDWEIEFHHPDWAAVTELN